MNKNITTFDQWATKGKDVGMEKGHYASVKQMFQIIDSELTKRYSVIDLGCGNGWVVRKFKKHPLCKTAHGLDGAKTMIQKAIKADPKGTYLNEDINTWLPQKRYDVVFSMETLYYFQNPGVIINKIHDDVLNESGMLIMGVDHYAENKASLNWAEEFNLNITTLSINDWLSFFESAGFNKIHYKQVEKKENRAGTLIVAAYK